VQVLVVIIGLILSGLSGWFLYKMEEGVIFSEFQKEVNERAALLYREVSINFEVLRSLSIMFEGGKVPDSRKFESVAKHILERHSDIQALEWIPRIMHPERTAYELRRRQEFPEFEITERKKQGQMVPAEKRQEYFPVYYVEPYAGNEAALGFDLASNITRLETLEKARTNGKPLATASITLVQEQENQKGFLAFLPIFKEISKTPLSDSHDRLKGFILGVYRIGDIFNSSIRNVESIDIGIKLIDETLPYSHDLLYIHNKQKEFGKQERYVYTKELPEIWGRKWSLIASPSLNFIADKRSMLPVTTFVSGMIFTLLLALYLHFISKHTATIKRLYVEIQNEQEKLFVTLRSIGDGVITTDLDGKIVLINKVTEQLTGWRQQEALGRPIQEVFNIINEKTGKPCNNPVDIVLATGSIVGLSNHTALIARDGTQYIIEDSGAPIFNNESKIIGVVLVYRDVTEEKRTETELLKIKKLESVGVLAGGIAHDFNNILAAILGNVELAGMMIDPGSEASDLLHGAKKATLRAKGLTQQLLTFSKGGDSVKQKSSIDKIITDSANFVLHGSSAVCDYQIPEDLWKVEVDTGQISQVIQNIIINARHAMPDGGSIKVSCENCDHTKEKKSLPGKKYIKIVIADTGSGIPETYLEKIFDPYFSTKQMGSGLGLAICHSIISKHDGDISVQSELGKGTIFTICLPASLQFNQSTATSVKDTVGVLAEQNATIMVMDDESIIRDMSKNMLERFGHEVVLAENGHEAIELYIECFKKNRPVDIIIMDLTIPGGMGGKYAVQKILKINPEAKVVVASGYSNDPVVAHYQEYGFKGSIVKPFQWKELNELINSLLANK